MRLTRRALPRLFLGFGALALGGCTRNWSYRYRLTLDVETPEGVKSGSSVIENAWTYHLLPIPFTGRPMEVRDRGEAAVVDLGARGSLFALLAERQPDGSVSSSSDYAHYLPLKAFRRTGAITDSEAVGGKMAQLEKLRATAELTRAEIPFLARFRDIDDPKTVEAVDPNDLEKSFGPSVKLLRATIEITDDPVTTGIEKRLGWLPQVGKERGTLIPNPPLLLKDATVEQRVTPGQFTTFNIWSK